MWDRNVNGKTLTFHLAGINNQNFLMRDEETGTYWQQISGRAVFGPLRGSQLQLVSSDESSLALWRQEHPDGLVLAPVDRFAAHYESADWEQHVGKLPTVVPVSANTLPAREIVLGVAIGQDARAFPQGKVLSQSPLADTVGGTPILFVVGPDGVSIRCFRRLLGGKSAEFFRDTTSPDWALLDAESGSRWNFAGCAVSGARQGACLEPIPAPKDYWFDWQLYHPSTTIYQH